MLKTNRMMQQGEQICKRTAYAKNLHGCKGH